MSAGTMSLGRPGEFVRNVRNQAVTESCEGQAWAAGVELSSRSHGSDIHQVSARALYTEARIRQGQSRDTLVDEGTNGLYMAAAIETRGVVSEERCPFDAAKINEGLDLDVWESALNAKLIGVGALIGHDVPTLKACLDAGMPITFAQQVDRQFDDYDSGVLGVVGDGDRGWHCTTLIDYDGDGFVGLNSWGTDWGRAYRGFSGGFYWISAARLAQCVDFRVINAGPGRLT